MIKVEFKEHEGEQIPVYITGNMMDVRKEEAHQMELAAWFRYNFPGVIFHHSPNEGDVKPQYRDKQIRQGLHVGFGDCIILAEGEEGQPYLMLELKRSCKSMSSVSKEQWDTLASVLSNGGDARLCYGAPAAKLAICRYFGLTLCPDGHTIDRN